MAFVIAMHLGKIYLVSSPTHPRTKPLQFALLDLEKRDIVFENISSKIDATRAFTRISDSEIEMTW